MDITDQVHWFANSKDITTVEPKTQPKQIILLFQRLYNAIKSHKQTYPLWNRPNR